MSPANWTHTARHCLLTASYDSSHDNQEHISSWNFACCNCILVTLQLDSDILPLEATFRREFLALINVATHNARAYTKPQQNRRQPAAVLLTI